MSFFRRKSLFILLIGIILLVVLVGYSLTKRDNLSGPEKVIVDSVGWMQNIISQPANFFIDMYHSIGDIKITYEENKVLKEKLAEYKTLVYEVNELDKENKELRKTLDIVDSPRDFEPILATVISRSPERWLEQVTINRGTKHGVETNMAVMTVDGMIGKVTSVSNMHATVQLITGFDQLNRISATISRKGKDNVFGLIEGYDKEKEALVFRIMEQSGKKVKEEELVVSSSLGGKYPSGLPIGTIKEIEADPYGLTTKVYLEPSANIYDINQVIVIDRALDTDDDTENSGDK